jgi:prepilin-type processing-associated H-X9-DG protein
LIELLVVIAIIAVLASLLLPALSNAKRQAQSIVCTSNIRQLSLAVQMYLDDHANAFPEANESNLIQPSDWIYWDPRKTESMIWHYGGIEKSPIARYLGGFSTNLLRCPADRYLKILDQDPAQLDYDEFLDWQRYRFSYTLNRGERSTPSGVHYGMASLSKPVAWHWSAPSGFRFRSDMIVDPTQKIMLAEEPTYGELEALKDVLEHRFWGPSSSSSAWEWYPPVLPIDPLAIRHNGRSSAAFADGHIEKVKPEIGQMPEHYDPME